MPQLRPVQIRLAAVILLKGLRVLVFGCVAIFLQETLRLNQAEAAFMAREFTARSSKAMSDISTVSLT